MVRRIDEYKLNPYSTCLFCRNQRLRNDASRYCIAHPQKLPPEIWNAKNAECPYFEKEE